MIPPITDAGDAGLLCRFGDAIDRETSARVLAAVAALGGDRPQGVLDVLPGYATLLVVLDPGRADAAEVRAWMAGRLRSAPPRPAGTPRTVEIPVLYDPAVAPDLEPLAAEKGLTPAALAALHAAPLYHCHLIGFRPGFPFLGGLDPRLHAPRLATPRLRVPAGAVGIGGQQTGVYPVESPGGWRLIGRTPLRLFDPAAADPFLVRAGDQVRFVPIDAAAYAALRGGLM